MAYDHQKTFDKAIPPLIMVLVVRAFIGTLASKGVTADEETVWTIAAICYSAFLALVNWVKNHKRGDDPFKPIRPV